MWYDESMVRKQQCFFRPYVVFQCCCDSYSQRKCRNKDKIVAALQVQRKGLQKSQEIRQHIPFKDEYYKPFKRQMHDEIPRNSHKS